MEPVNRRVVHRYIEGEWKIQQDNIANESILDIDIKRGKEIERWLSIIRTPGNDSEFAQFLDNAIIELLETAAS